MKILFAATTAMLLLAGCDGAGDKATTPAVTNTATQPVALAPGATDWTTTVVATPEGGFRMGNPNAPVKLVEFASMTCAHCRAFSADSKPGLENYVKSGQVSFEFRNFVMNQIDVVSSLLARCGGPGPFFKITEQMFAEQDATLAKVQAGAAQLAAAEQLPGAQTFVRVAEVIGLDKFVGMRGIPAAKAKACLTSEAETNKLVEMQTAAIKSYKIPGTPTFLINGKVLDPAPPGAEIWADLEPKIKAAIGA